MSYFLDSGAKFALLLPLAGFVILVPKAQAQSARPTIAVLELVDKGAGPDLSSNLSSTVSTTLGSLGSFSVISSQEIQQMLLLETQKQQLGCDDDASCIAEIGGALGARYVVSGSVGKIGKTLVLNLQLMDQSKAEILARKTQELPPTEQALLKEVKHTTQMLVQGLLKTLGGFLVVRLAEENANIEINDTLVAVSPSPRIKLSSGPQRLAIKKDGFVVWGQDLSIIPDQTYVVDAVLVPSPKFVERYEKRAKAYRIAAWSTAGLGLAGSVTGLALVLSQAAKRDELGRDIRTYNADPDASLNSRQSLEERIGGVERDFLIYQIVAYSGVALLGLSSYFWIAGDPPGKYREFRDKKITAGGAPIPGGFAAQVGAAF